VTIPTVKDAALRLLALGHGGPVEDRLDAWDDLLRALVRERQENERTSCVFCRMWEGSEPHEAVRCFRFENAPDVMVIRPLNPVTPGHLLVIPETHVSDASVAPATAAATMRAAAVVAQDMAAANIITSKGEAATQSIYHLHVHVVPRRFGDGLALPWTASAEVGAS
jgi:histidine triad (HIT) family protein